MFDVFIPAALWFYGLGLVFAIALPQSRGLDLLLPAAAILRLFCTGFRTSLGSDIAPYTSLLTDCDLSTINAVELFWQLACLPSFWGSGASPFPFLWVGIVDTILFLVLVKVGGWRVAAFHELIYLPSTAMGAIRQALALKLLMIAVLMHMCSRRLVDSRPATMVMSLPMVHLPSIVPAIFFVFYRSGVAIRALILAAGIAASYAATPLIDAAHLGKLLFYLDFDGFRRAQDIYNSWIKRIFVIGSGLFLTRPNLCICLFYGIGLIFAATEPWVPEIAVRIGAYFEQFEVLIVSASMKPQFRRLWPLWYGSAGLAYAVRYVLNVKGLPWEG